MEEIKVGDEYWICMTPKDKTQIPYVKKIVIKDIFTVMVTVDSQGQDWSLDVAKEDLFKTQEEALHALHETLDRAE
jgi:hypothetical protein